MPLRRRRTCSGAPFPGPCLEELVSGIERRRLAQVTTEREHRVLHGEVCSGFARAAHVAQDVLSRIAEEIRDRRARAGTANRNLKHHAAILLVVSAEGKDVVNAAVVVQLHGKMGFCNDEEQCTSIMKRYSELREIKSIMAKRLGDRVVLG